MTSSQSCSSCSKATCKGFSQSSHGAVSMGVGITSICHCGDIVVMKVAKTSRNAGRKFWGCRHYKGGFSTGMSCNFFKWCSEDNVDDRDGTIVRQSNKICDLENNVKELQRRIKFVVGVVFAVIVLNIMTLWLCLG
ncbi:uncharacterized protein LOC124825706 [Vigna umbellata]|uniref:uncharacterized protein LOC124825706 n=1 Tax=Vigna umbellata TaxID=87088 RepID=UPI001F5E945A|nr:uncharacterized protein LOC124825706 [Vigna umbellata]